jgi:hypothetical protein
MGVSCPTVVKRVTFAPGDSLRKFHHYCSTGEDVRTIIQQVRAGARWHGCGER